MSRRWISHGPRERGGGSALLCSAPTRHGGRATRPRRKSERESRGGCAVGARGWRSLVCDGESPCLPGLAAYERDQQQEKSLGSFESTSTSCCSRSTVYPHSFFSVLGVVFPLLSFFFPCWNHFLDELFGTNLESPRVESSRQPRIWPTMFFASPSAQQAWTRFLREKKMNSIEMLDCFWKNRRGVWRDQEIYKGTKKWMIATVVLFGTRI